MWALSGISKIGSFVVSVAMFYIYFKSCLSNQLEPINIALKYIALNSSYCRSHRNFVYIACLIGNYSSLMSRIKIFYLNHWSINVIICH